MLNTILRWIIFSVIIVFVSWIIPGIHVDNFVSAMLVSVILAFINTFIKPFIQLITLPVTVVTLGIFSLIINALMLMLAGWIAPGFEVGSFASAFFGAIVLSILTIGIRNI